MNKAPFFNQERMLELVSFRYSKHFAIYGDLFVCNQCLPIVVSHGVPLKAFVGEDDMVFGHVFMDNEWEGKVCTPALHRLQTCANCDSSGTCWKLHIRLSSLEYVSDRKRATKILSDWKDTEVIVAGRKGHVTSCMGHDVQRPWITLYTIKLEDGNYIELYRWQFQIVSKS